MEKKLTRLRREVVSAIMKAEKPLDARALRRLIPMRVDLSSVYRALEYLEKSGAIRGMYFFDSTRFYCARHAHYHFVMCRDCHEIRHFDECGIGRLQNRLERDMDYRIDEHVVFMMGRCEACRKSFEKKMHLASRIV